MQLINIFGIFIPLILVTGYRGRGPISSESVSESESEAEGEVIDFIQDADVFEDPINHPVSDEQVEADLMKQGLSAEDVQAIVDKKANFQDLFDTYFKMDTAKNSTKLSMGDFVLLEDEWDIAIDIITSRIREVSDHKVRRKRKITASLNRLWDKDIKFVFTDSVSDSLRTTVLSAVARLNQDTCLNIEDATGLSPVVPYVMVSGDSEGCYAFGIGKSIQQPQVINLGAGCDYVGVAWHEIGHVLGLYHEHTRVNRDEYVIWKSENTLESAAPQFAKCDLLSENCNADVPYDYSSVMHYNPLAFSTDSSTLLTLDAVDPYYLQTMGLRAGPSFFDNKQINQVYCQDSCPTNSTKCHNGGYNHPKDCTTCICPSVFAGKKCNSLAPSQPTAGACGADLVAGCDWETLQTKNYPSNEIQDNLKCVWRIKGNQPDDRIEFEFTDELYMWSGDGSIVKTCRISSLDIRATADFGKGQKVCGYPRSTIDLPYVTSETNTLVLMSENTEGNQWVKGFKGRYKVVGPSCRKDDCLTSNWSSWSECTTTCGTGYQVRSREVARPASGEGTPCGDLEETKECSLNSCPEDCVLGTWQEWSACSGECGGVGTQTRGRPILAAQQSGGGCSSELNQNRDCSTEICTTMANCLLNQWSDWTECTQTCGGGSRNRRRGLENGNQDVCDDELEEIKSCNEEACPVDCKMFEWTSWFPCTATCGYGMQTRLRPIWIPNEEGGIPCGKTEELRECKARPCRSIASSSGRDSSPSSSLGSSEEAEESESLEESSSESSEDNKSLFLKRRGYV